MHAASFADPTSSAIVMPKTRLFAALALLACTTALADTPKRKVIIDQDAYGAAGSNQQAILMLLQAPDVELLGITVVSGDGWRDENVAHALRLLEVAQRTEVPVFAGAVLPLVNNPARTRAWEMRFGKLVYKGAWTESWPAYQSAPREAHPDDPWRVPPVASGLPDIKPAPGTAMDFLIRKTREFPGEVTIIAAGPLTNLALTARIDPDFARNAKELVFMGGSYNPLPADNAFAAEYAHNPRLEFNLRFDPEAASAVLHETWRKVTQLPVDPTTRSFWSDDFIRRAGAGRTPFAGYLGRFGLNLPMWDEMAVAVWLDPTLVTRADTVLVDVDTDSAGSGYGSTLSWPVGHGPGMGERPVKVVREVDVKRFERMTLDLLTQPRR
ncbi:nucleoside hydrolase [Derxia gummosa]|uniref:Nucleoside hydrolase n=1 Tax=Derxia gummosa DSM 723 TaxID=1121388 RepID=A0A8B6XD47_9BURK|nr:nucleoside hydrolase [Derxia gummosa]